MGESSLLKRISSAAPAVDDPVRQAADELATRHIGEEAAPPPSLETRRMAGVPHARVDGRLTEGTILQNRYYILGVLGSGGMSTVYKARDMHFPKVERLCAIKEMLNTATDPQVREMVTRNFEREASLMATLRHPAIPQVYDYFTEGDRSYLVIEFVHGKDLETLLNETRGFLSESQVVNWALQICDILIYLYNHKPNPVVFRDMKPSNIMLDEQGRIHLVDFGIAKVFQSGEKGTMIGTEGYSPPEQYRGVAEPRGDIYALGATLHHLLTKQDPRLEPPFSFHERPIHAANPTVSSELQEIINRALEYDINRRFGSAEELRRALLSLRVAQGYTTPGTMVIEEVDSEAHRALWQFACEDEIRSSPVVHHGVLYIGSYDNNLYALDAERGQFKWKYAAEGGIPTTPCVAEGKVFFGSQDRTLYAVNIETGRLVWTCPTKGRIYSSPQAMFGHVFFGSDDRRLYAVNIASGRQAWAFEAESMIRSRPSVGQEAIYFGDESGSLYAVGVSGKLIWRFRARRSIMSCPLLTKEMVIFGSQDWHVYALDLRSGWAVWKYRTNGPIVSSATFAGGTVYIGSADGEIYALDADDGYVVWRYKTGGQVTSSPTFHEGAIYVGCVDGCLYSLDAQTGQLRWRFRTNGPVISTPFVANDVVYFGSVDNNVYALPV